MVERGGLKILSRTLRKLGIAISTAIIGLSAAEKYLRGSLLEMRMLVAIESIERRALEGNCGCRSAAAAAG
jgi:hypothetical protein